MAIDIFSIEPHKVSRDLRGYLIYMFGPPKAGKTRLGCQFPKPLLIATERGFNTIAGIRPQLVNNWSEIRQVMRQLKEPRAKEMYESIIVDTVDLAGTMCEKYVCDQLGVQSIKAIPYGDGWTKLKKEFEEVFRTIANEGYAVYFTSHSKETTLKLKTEEEYNVIRPTATNTFNGIVENMCDIIGYMHPVARNGEKKVVISVRTNDDELRTGTRFKHFPHEIDYGYQNLIDAINYAIDKEAEESGEEFITEKPQEIFQSEKLNFDKMIQQFSDLINGVAEREDFAEKIAPEITNIIENYLGVVKKVSDCTRAQVEQLQLIILDIKDFIKEITE